MIGEAAIAAMKRGVRVINTARGPLVDENAMAAALESGKVAGYMADVLRRGTARARQPAAGHENAILTPHVAWAPLQTRQRLLNIVVGNVAAFVKEAPTNVVNG